MTHDREVSSQESKESTGRVSAPSIGLLLLILLCLPLTVLPNSDSLEAVISTSQGVKRVQARLDYAGVLASTDADAAIQQAKWAVAESQSINAPLLTMDSQYKLAQLYMKNSQNDTAEVYLLQALPVAKTHALHAMKSRIQMDLGTINKNRGIMFKPWLFSEGRWKPLRRSRIIAQWAPPIP